MNNTRIRFTEPFVLAFTRGESIDLEGKVATAFRPEGPQGPVLLEMDGGPTYVISRRQVATEPGYSSPSELVFDKSTIV